MEEKDNITPEAQPEEAAQNVDDSADAPGAVDNPAPEADSTEDTVKEDALEKINKELGKEFPDLDTALKSIKDTQSYVGKKQDDAVEAAKETLKGSGDYMTKSEFKEQMFFKDNPETAPYKDVISAVAKAEGIGVEEAASSEGVKALIEKAGKYDQSESAKSVLETNPRLQSSSDRNTEAAEALKAGNPAKANTLATKSVLEAFGKKD